MLTLFVFSTKDGWVKLMYNGIDAVGVDKEVNILSLAISVFVESFILSIGHCIKELEYS